MMTQKEAMKILKMGKNVFLTGPAGSGKTFVLNEYIKFLKDHGVEVAVTASTGIAATHLKGMTIHSWTGIGIKDFLTDYDLDNLEQKAYLWKRFEKTKVLIIDEISMLSSSTMDCIDRVAKVFKRSEEPFGGLQVIFSGDFFQLPPIDKKPLYNEQIIFLDEEEVSKTPFAFKSRAWKNCDLHTCYLSEQYRQEDNVLVDLLSEIRSGELSEKSIEILKKRIIKEDNPEITKLYTHNINVDSFNFQKLQNIKSDERAYLMSSRGKPNLIDALKRGCLVQERLVVKKGALVMFVKNNPIAGYINGTVGEVTGFEEGYPVVQTKNGNSFIASPQSWSVEEGDKVLAEISQVPLKLAWAVTIHKSQGMTLEKAIIDLSNSFVEGQGYVALSRVKTLDGLFLKGFNAMALAVHNEILNLDQDLKDHSEQLFVHVNKMTPEEFAKEHQDFFVKIGGKKYKVVDEIEQKLTTYEITHKMLKEEKSFKEMAEERDVKIGTILSHIEKLLEEKVITKKDIEYLKPKTKEF
ncbi:MAG: AAA family ATPase, partial [Candidatus Pacebacteria bacterium]|nr:AAA family ATPase [Candidatus Paceibacterota bacterium]